MYGSYSQLLEIRVTLLQINEEVLFVAFFMFFPCTSTFNMATEKNRMESNQ